MNRHLLWIFPMFAVAAVYLGMDAYRRGTTRTAEDLMLEFEQELALVSPNMEAALYKIQIALDLAEKAGEEQKQAVILKRRAKLYRDLNRSQHAREDYELLLERFTPDDKDSIRRLAQLEFDDGDRVAALARLEDVLEVQPTWSTGLFHRANFYLAMCDEELDLCEQVCSQVMNDKAATRASALTVQIVARSAEDPRRAAMMHEVSQLFPTGSESERRTYNDLASRASTLLESAFADHAKALERSNSTTAMTGVLNILRRSGRFKDAASFGLASLQRLARTGSRSAPEALFASLHEAGWDHEAIRVSPLFIDGDRKYTANFFKDLLAACYATESWELVPFAANRLRGIYAGKKPSSGRTQANLSRSESVLYQGLASHHTGKHKEAATLLGQYRMNPVRSIPFPGALLVAETARAASAATLSDKSWRRKEEQALKTALVLRKDAAGKDWLTLLELQSTLGSSVSDIENTLAHLMAAFPGRVSEFEPAWRSRGQKAMNQAVLDVSDVRRQLTQSEQFVPQENLGSFANFRLAEQYASEREWYGVLAATEKVFESVPYLSPAVNLYLKACDQLGLNEMAIELLLGRLEYIGPQSLTIVRLTRLKDSLTPAQELRLFRIDPTGLGRNSMIRELVDRGKFEQARIALTSVPNQNLSPEGHLLLGEALQGLDRSEAALLSLRRVPVESHAYPRAFGLILETALETGDRPLLDSTIEQLVRPSAPIETGLIPTLDRLLTAGEIKLAQKVALFLDSDSSTRSGRNMLRLASIQMLVGEFDSVPESLERAYAYRNDGGPIIGQVLLAIQTEDWSSLPRLLADYEDEHPNLNIETAMVIALLRGRPQVVRDFLDEVSPQSRSTGINQLLSALASSERKQVLAAYPEHIRAETIEFLDGPPDDVHDPRHVLGLLLALQVPDWQVWLIGELHHWRTEGNGVWVDFLEAETLLRLRALPRADAKITRYVTRWPDFLPAWELANRLQVEQPVASADLLDFAKNGWSAPGHPGALQSSASVKKIKALRAADRQTEALGFVREALDLAPDNGPLLYQLGKIHEEQGRFEAALITMGRFVSGLPRRARNAVLPELLAILDRGYNRGAIQEELRRQTLEAFSRDYPANALVAARLAENDLDRTLRRNPIGAVYDVYERLHKFRSATDHAPIRSLGTGGLEAWHELYLTLDPERCEKFIRMELQLNPRLPELWAMLAESLYAQGRRAEADEEIELLLSIVPEQRALELRIQSLLRQGGSSRQIGEVCETLAALRGWDLDHPELKFWRARAKANGNQAEALLGIRDLRALWNIRSGLLQDEAIDDSPGFIVAVGRAYGVAAMRAGTREDHASAQKVFAMMSNMALPGTDRRLYATISQIGPDSSDAALPEANLGDALAAARGVRGNRPLTAPNQPQGKVTPEQMMRFQARRAGRGEPRASTSKYTPEQIAEHLKQKAAEARAAGQEPPASANKRTAEERAEHRKLKAAEAGAAGQKPSASTSKYTPEQKAEHRKQKAAEARAAGQEPPASASKHTAEERSEHRKQKAAEAKAQDEDANSESEPDEEQP